MTHWLQLTRLLYNVYLFKWMHMVKQIPGVFVFFSQNVSLAFIHRVFCFLFIEVSQPNELNDLISLTEL